MVYFYLARMEFGSTYVACGSFEDHYFFSYVLPSCPVFGPAPETFIDEYLFSYYFFLCGVGVVPGLSQELLGFVFVG